MDSHKDCGWFSLSVLVLLISSGWIFCHIEYCSSSDGSQQKSIVPGKLAGFDVL